MNLLHMRHLPPKYIPYIRLERSLWLYTENVSDRRRHKRNDRNNPRQIQERNEAAIGDKEAAGMATVRSSKSAGKLARRRAGNHNEKDEKKEMGGREGS